MVSLFVDGDRFEPVFRPAMEAVLAVADTDEDGLVQPQEFLLIHEAFGRSEQDSEYTFAALDRDGDGTLGTAELLTWSSTAWLNDVLTLDKDEREADLSNYVLAARHHLGLTPPARGSSAEAIHHSYTPLVPPGANVCAVRLHGQGFARQRGTRE